MKFSDRYFQLHPVSLELDFGNNPEVVVIIPVFNDGDIFMTVDSLCECSCIEGNAGVVVIVNHSEICPEEVKTANRKLAEELNTYTKEKQKETLEFRVVEAYDLPAKYAGVGLARKMAMDAAANFLFNAGKSDCPILSLDADTWVEKNYFDEVVRFFRIHAVAGVSIAYAHRLEVNHCQEEIREAIFKYELYLRYYQQALAYTGHPHAFPCIGSAFAVRASDYVAQGGMNKRQAGEDFYFLQKLIATGRYAMLNTTTVYPSARISQRTPFGTGQAILQIIGNQGKFPVYHFEAFRLLKYFFCRLEELFKAGHEAVSMYCSQQPGPLKEYLDTIEVEKMLAEVNANCASEYQFRKRFFDHFNAFRVLKYLNYVHERHFEKVDVLEALKMLAQETGIPFSGDLGQELERYRGKVS